MGYEFVGITKGVVMNKELLKLHFDTDVLEAEQKEDLKVPHLYQVILHNDDYTPMGFVVEVLQKIFFYSEEKATALMWEVHKKGKTDCGKFTRDIAESKVALVNDYARQNEHPLLCSMLQI